LSETKRRIGILTSGGDAPGMNAVIRAVVRTARQRGLEVIGIRRGYDGLIYYDVLELKSSSVSNIINMGGTMLLTARCQEMMTSEGRQKAADVCKSLSLDALIVIGGDGSLTGAIELSKRGINVIGVPGTIDLDLECTEYTIGFDTAVNTAMKAINKIRDTSSSHERCSLVEVMGRNCGQIALWSSITGGAEEVLLPESNKIDIDRLVEQIKSNRAKGKRHNLIIIAEGVGGTASLAKQIESITGIETRATILGHLQRGGSPSALDRMHASIMGYKVVELFMEGKKNFMMTYNNGTYSHMDIREIFNVKRQNMDLYEITKTLSI
jgi:6-phosphofructokinase 1